MNEGNKREMCVLFADEMMVVHANGMGERSQKRSVLVLGCRGSGLLI